MEHLLEGDTVLSSWQQGAPPARFPRNRVPSRKSPEDLAGQPEHAGSLLTTARLDFRVGVSRLASSVEVVKASVRRVSAIGLILSSTGFSGSDRGASPWSPACPTT